MDNFKQQLVQIAEDDMRWQLEFEGTHFEHVRCAHIRRKRRNRVFNDA